MIDVKFYFKLPSSSTNNNCSDKTANIYWSIIMFQELCLDCLSLIFKMLIIMIFIKCYYYDHFTEKRNWSFKRLDSFINVTYLESDRAEILT